jgi:hypothetical protein
MDSTKRNSPVHTSTNDLNQTEQRNPSSKNESSQLLQHTHEEIGEHGQDSFLQRPQINNISEIQQYDELIELNSTISRKMRESRLSENRKSRGVDETINSPEGSFSDP